MTTRKETPTFEAWLEYCFTRGLADFHGQSPDAADERITRFEGYSPAIGGHILRLFESPAVLADRFTDAQLADGVRYIFGTPSQYFIGMKTEAPPGLIDRCVRASLAVFTDLFDPVCLRREAEGVSERTPDSFEQAVIDIWDSGYDAIAMPQDATDAEFEAGLFVIGGVLERCRSGACLLSGIEGALAGLLANPRASGRGRRLRGLEKAMLRRDGVPQEARAAAEEALRMR
ncbi:MAG: hypothetical protein EA423_03420 [Phycisphaerales bacterium]|nr:MAG: hypothetical protein EA423_03420 [Phycisphaerales bacterium]